jgi:hypothetical protein
MGEIHFARVAPEHWERELRKMRSGGLTMASTYVFWIHHEEVEGTFDWSGRRDLRRFVTACGEVGLPVIVRMGPWCHGEVRNGGIPDWALRACKTRTDDPKYLAYAKRLYGEIGKQLDGLLWKQGGPVIGAQVENEFGGPGEHLMSLKRLALEAGLDVPFFTKTAWPRTKTPVPQGEMLPMDGAYAEGFWDRVLTPMPGGYRRAFQFSHRRASGDIGTDQLGHHAPDDAEAKVYPYLTCELGGGMEQSYHRRVLIDPRDTMALLVTRLGSGSNLPGYYMYHGGTNPESATGISLEESQATNYANDMPKKSYDFQAALGQWGQVREPFHLLRRVHLFLADFGAELTQMASRVPDVGKGEVRWAVRADGAGKSGYLFVSNHERLAELAGHEGVTFDGLPFPAMAVPAHACFILPFGLRVGEHRLEWATAQLLCRVGRAYFFAEVPGVAARFAFENQQVIEGSAGFVPVAKFEDAEVYLLDEASSLGAYRVGDRVVVSPRAVVVEEGGGLVLETEAVGELPVWVYPGGRKSVGWPNKGMPVARAELVKEAGALREIKMGSHKVAEAPGEEAFGAAAVWRIAVPEGLAAGTMLRVRYTGDVARFYAGGRFLVDHFCNNGRAFDLSVDVLPAGTREVELKVLPLQKGAPIYFSSPVVFGEGEGSVARLESVEWVGRGSVRVAGM